MWYMGGVANPLPQVTAQTTLSARTVHVVSTPVPRVYIQAASGDGNGATMAPVAAVGGAGGSAVQDFALLVNSHEPLVLQGVAQVTIPQFVAAGGTAHVGGVLNVTSWGAHGHVVDATVLASMTPPATSVDVTTHAADVWQAWLPGGVYTDATGARMGRPSFRWTLVDGVFAHGVAPPNATTPTAPDSEPLDVARLQASTLHLPAGTLIPGTT